MKTHHTDEQIQSVIDAACLEVNKMHRPSGEALAIDNARLAIAWNNEAPARLALARGLLARLPEPTPPVSADGKTPGQVAFESFYEVFTWLQSSPQTRAAWEKTASAVLAAFGQGGMEAAISRMEAVPDEELRELYFSGPGTVFDRVRARLIAAARDGQGEAVDWKAKYEAAEKRLREAEEGLYECSIQETADSLPNSRRIVHQYDAKAVLDQMAGLKARAEKAEAELARVRHIYDSRIEELERPSLPQLRPIAEAEIPWTEWHGGPCPLRDDEVDEWEWKARIGGREMGARTAPPSEYRWKHTREDGDIIAYRVLRGKAKPEPATFTAHGKTWTRHTPGDPMPCDGEAKICVIYRTDESYEFNGIGMILDAKDLTWDEIIGWRYADEPTPATLPLIDVYSGLECHITPDGIKAIKPAWQPAVGELVRLKSGGPVMTVVRPSDGVDGVLCEWFNSAEEYDAGHFQVACLTPATKKETK